jgi:hypothetical protein
VAGRIWAEIVVNRRENNGRTELEGVVPPLSSRMNESRLLAEQTDRQTKNRLESAGRKKPTGISVVLSVTCE